MGSVSVAPTTGTPAALAIPSILFGRRVARLAVVDQELDLVVLRSFSNAATSDALGSVLFITASWND